MSTIIYPSPVFGPVHSRRLGVSLGINLMPGDGKICSFDCIYCECGLNADHRPRQKRPSREEVYNTLKEGLIKMQTEGVTPDVLTFAGNGEPTLHPEFAAIVADVRELRNDYCPSAKISVLSNATRITDPEIFQALMLVDNNIQKLDTVNPHFIGMVDAPTGHFAVDKTIDALCRFNGHVIIQTMFLTGETYGKIIDNTTAEYVEPWIEALKKIAPRQVMIYTIDRETPISTLRKASPQKLDQIAQRVTECGLSVQTSY